MYVDTFLFVSVVHAQLHYRLLKLKVFDYVSTLLAFFEPLPVFRDSRRGVAFLLVAQRQQLKNVSKGLLHCTPVSFEVPGLEGGRRFHTLVGTYHNFVHYKCRPDAG